MIKLPFFKILFVLFFIFTMAPLYAQAENYSEEYCGMIDKCPTYCSDTKKIEFSTRKINGYTYRLSDCIMAEEDALKWCKKQKMRIVTPEDVLTEWGKDYDTSLSLEKLTAVGEWIQEENVGVMILDGDKFFHFDIYENASISHINYGGWRSTTPSRRALCTKAPKNPCAKVNCSECQTCILGQNNAPTCVNKPDLTNCAKGDGVCLNGHCTAEEAKGFGLYFEWNEPSCVTHADCGKNFFCAPKHPNKREIDESADDNKCRSVTFEKKYINGYTIFMPQQEMLYHNAVAACDSVGAHLATIPELVSDWNGIGLQDNVTLTPLGEEVLDNFHISGLWVAPKVKGYYGFYLDANKEISDTPLIDALPIAREHPALCIKQEEKECSVDTECRHPCQICADGVCTQKETGAICQNQGPGICNELGECTLQKCDKTSDCPQNSYCAKIYEKVYSHNDHFYCITPKTEELVVDGQTFWLSTEDILAKETEDFCATLGKQQVEITDVLKSELAYLHQKLTPLGQALQDKGIICDVPCKRIAIKKFDDYPNGIQDSVIIWKNGEGESNSIPVPMSTPYRAVCK